MLKWLLAILAVLAALVAGLYFYYLYVPIVPPPALAGELRGAELEVDGERRSLRYYLPAAHAPGAPLLFALHGSRSDGSRARYGFGYRFDLLADQHGFIAVYPDGYQQHWNDCRGGANYLANTEDIDDIAFFRAMVEHFRENYGIDPAKVLVTGISNGGQMAYKLALEAPDLVAAVAPVIASLPVSGESDCRASGASVPIAIVNGTQDPVNPYEGGVVDLFGDTSRGTVMSSLDSARYFAGLAGHARETASLRLADLDPEDATTIELTAWQSPGLDEVLHYAVTGGGHTVPSRTVVIPRILGRTSRDIEAADEIWDFFQRAIGGSR